MQVLRSDWISPRKSFKFTASIMQDTRYCVEKFGAISLFRCFAIWSPASSAMEACTTAHHWARELIALGHAVKLMPPACVKAYVKRNKNDAADAEAICEAVTRRQCGSWLSNRRMPRAFLCSIGLATSWFGSAQRNSAMRAHLNGARAFGTGRVVITQFSSSYLYRDSTSSW